ncbi:MAG: transcriptional regulator [Rickettsiaceae bacterium]|jgi:DNA-binding protein HU-beta|nr:transcriptional regulator [Rickettsiaceae bacterium]
MNKEQLVSEIASSTGKTKKEAQDFLNAYIEIVTGALSANDNVQLAGLGSFVTKKRKATTGRNPRTGQEIKIAAKNVVKFSPAKKLKDAVN